MRTVESCNHSNPLLNDPKIANIKAPTVQAVMGIFCLTTIRQTSKLPSLPNYQTIT